MTDIEKVLTEVREALKAIHKTSLCQRRTGETFDWMAAEKLCEQALTAFTADMPGAIGEVVEYGRLLVGPQYVAISKDAHEKMRAALAKLEVKS